MKWFRDIGPGVLIAAAFIGPGTVTLCTIAGASFGYSLIWAIILSTFSTIVLQEMSLRIGLVTRMNLAEVIRTSIKSVLLNRFIILLIISSILIGNAAYEAGNITGASLGISAIINNQSVNYFPILIGLIAFIILYQGNYKILERSLISLVLLMSISFFITAIMTKPDITNMLNGIFKPKVNSDNLLIILGLIGTTVVPYNIFLHSSLVSEKWNSIHKLRVARLESFISILLGGLISLSIIITAASVTNQNITGVIDLAKGLEPLYGKFAIYFLGIGLFASGITSSITAPLAAAYVAKSCFGWNDSLKSKRFRMVWIFILIIGVSASMVNINPIEIIKFAQFSNSLLLPIIAIILLWLINNKNIISSEYNYRYQNVLGIFIVIISLILGVKGLISLL
ncbi:MAG: Nramp family divalent metal transporter [Cryomorphaceae bacterium]|jgi:NRAMP (natural resistance-associated macrophage protein)-like metal ion transporter|nr:Nramp family divalent metal transporter [Cryomorphaceae bacterium]MBT3689179.1 Nramp family divalent metal transporter [Cryomorphaceae bacterium]MBT4222754.1 Nramp family divalent metal transporter [Cryomorphaceae bacterium]MBT4293669.1 Nramp family divalent metal transporter [Cryomorphaceae bacterium]MBT4834758.1 Nramp family divalent metal transporter [Cryomorphaceae bacterium]|tara:strand:+ start:26 stop:1216 length:1191 start_codon:yes stop_codon:yes gene_type:complete